MRTNMFTDQNGDRFEAPNMCILITDGTPTVNVDRTLPEAIQSRVDGKDEIRCFQQSIIKAYLMFYFIVYW